MVFDVDVGIHGLSMQPRSRFILMHNHVTNDSAVVAANDSQPQSKRTTLMESCVLKHVSPARVLQTPGSSYWLLMHTQHQNSNLAAHTHNATGCHVSEDYNSR